MTDRRHLDPYAPAPRVVAGEVPVFPSTRLRRLGATPERLRDLGASWDSMSVAERKDFVEAMSVMTDQQLAIVLRDDP